MRNRLKALGTAIIIASITFSFTDVEEVKQEINTDNRFDWVYNPGVDPIQLPAY